MTFILCPECGNCLGEIIKFVTLAKKGLLQQVIKKSYPDHALDKIDLDKENINIGFVLDLIGANMVCCRQHLLGSHENDRV